jgi:hypothetical protein
MPLPATSPHPSLAVLARSPPTRVARREPGHGCSPEFACSFAIRTFLWPADGMRLHWASSRLGTRRCCSAATIKWLNDTLYNIHWQRSRLFSVLSTSVLHAVNAGAVPPKVTTYSTAQPTTTQGSPSTRRKPYQVLNPCNAQVGLGGLSLRV